MCKKLTTEEREEVKKALREAFDAFDTDKSQHIESKEFENVLRQYNDTQSGKNKLDDAKIKDVTGKFIKIADKNADGKVSFKEFFDFMLEALGLQ